jgi:hypothetical protein
LYSNNPTTGHSIIYFLSLAAGSYILCRDNKECQNSVVVTITQPANALAANSCSTISCSLQMRMYQEQ